MNNLREDAKSVLGDYYKNDFYKELLFIILICLPIFSVTSVKFKDRIFLFLFLLVFMMFF